MAFADGLDSMPSNEASATALTPFTISVKTDNSGDSASDEFILPTVSSGTYNFYVVDDSGTDLITTWNQAEVTRSFGVAGTYEIKIYGQFEGIQVQQDLLKILEISSWGDVDLLSGIGSGGGHFFNCSNLNITATNRPITANTTNLVNSFRGTAITSFSDWDFSNVTQADRAFFQCSSLIDFNNVDISSCFDFPYVCFDLIV